MADSHMDSPDPPSARAITALLREARSVSRRADKLGGTAAALDDLTTQQLAAAACTSIEQLVHHRGCLSASCSDARRREFVDNFRRTRSAYATRRPGRDQLGTPDTSRSGLPLARPDRHSACSNACPIPLLTANAPLRTVPKTSP